MRLCLKSAVTATRTCGVRFVLAAFTVSGWAAGMGNAAYAQTIEPQIAGGAPSNVLWGVRVSAVVNGGTQLCSGVQVNPDWVITAAHCLSSQVQFSNGAGGFSGATVTVDKAIDSPTGDVKLMHLSTPHPLAVYPEVDLGYVPHAGDTGTLYGSGIPNLGQLRQAAMTVVDAGVDGGGHPAVHVVGRSGSGQPGDSGSPLLINGKLVGVLSTSTVHGATNDDNWVANLAASKDLVSSALIGNLSLDSGGISVALGREYFYSKQRIMIWVNGNYFGETYNGAAYYASATPTNSGVTLRLGTHLNPGDYVQVGIVPGVPGNTPPSPSSARLFAQQAFDAARSVSRINGLAIVELSKWLVASKQHVIIWINGNYAAHTDSGSVYYSDYFSNGDSVIIRPATAVKDGDEIVVGIDLTPTNSVPSPSAPQVRVLAKTVL